jgi:glucose/mannose-6-phosphate isomerase
MAFYNVFSEMNHNEITAYELIPDNMSAIMLRDDKDNERIKKRMDICKDLMKKIDVVEVSAKGKSLLARMLYLTLIGDWASYFAAINNEVDPTPVDIIESLKKKLVE